MLIDNGDWSRFVLGHLDEGLRDAISRASLEDHNVAARLRIMGAVIGREIVVDPVECAECGGTDGAETVSEVQRFRDALQRMRSGSDEAAWDLVKQFAPHIFRVVRRRLSQQLRSKYDSQDFVQMVWASLFREPSRILDFSHPDDFTRFVMAMARNKVIDETRRRNTAKYNVDVEESFHEEAVPPTRLDTPSQVAIAHECWSQMMGAESERNQRIVQLRLQGFTYREIAEDVGLNEKTARIIVDRLISKGTVPKTLGDSS
ncbi:MAG: sigma-70 family RNA polymerase sigma factor [Pirellulaceae bacterium]|nr:sigma-70 family RNA polymerase sigma factor [Pirellulaceae bacterium]MDP7014738.1 sigma-70 family RNA polymerase sigma factor [Pirellulaceae bacterium]